MTTPQKGSLSANEPVLVGAFVSWLFTVVGTFVLGHTDLVTNQQWSSLTTLLVPVVSALVLAAVAWVVRKFVAPAWKVVVHEGGKVGLSDAELSAFVKDEVAKEFDVLKAKFPVLQDIENTPQAG